MEAVDGPLVAVFAQGYDAVLKALLDVMGIAWTWLIADGARKQLYSGDVRSLSGREFI